MPDRDHSPIPGAPADSLVGLGGNDGFVGQCERELCLSTPPPPPEPKESITRSYPPIPVPKFPEMPLGARMLRPWMAAVGGALLIAVVGLASGDEDEGSAESADRPVATSFGADVRETASATIAASRARAEAAAQAAEEAVATAPPGEDDDEREASNDDASERRVASSSPTKKATKKAKAKGDFNRDAARSAIFSAASRASGCRTKNGPKGRGRATVTIGPSGRVTSVSVSPPFAGTKSGSCVASVFRSVRIAPFSGSAVTLGKSFTVR